MLVELLRSLPPVWLGQGQVAEGVRGMYMDTGAMMDSVTFLANFPPIQSAIKVGQDGARIQLDVPETELAAMLPLVMWRDRVLRVTVEVER